MAQVTRKQFQAVTNIIRFNWQYYVIALFSFALVYYIGRFLPAKLSLIVNIFLILVALSIFISLSVSYYIYDYSELYALSFVDKLNITQGSKLVNINAGFDEISEILALKFPASELKVFDFYDPKKHTEVSIERARKAYPPYPGTVIIATGNVPLKSISTDYIFLILAAHEIRDNNEREMFIKQLGNALTPQGRIIVVEHQRDLFNFLAYNFGFFHFLPTAMWLDNFKNSGLQVDSITEHTPFLKIFILKKNGTAS